MSSEEVVYHLQLEPDEVTVAAQALRLLISDEAHEQQLRGLAHEVLDQLDGDRELTPVALTAPEMKVFHSAVRLLLNDSQREQGDERRLLWSILGKLPDEHSIRAIELP